MLTALIGYRTYIMSAIFGVAALILQADAEALIHLAPMLKMIVTMVMTISAPLAFAFMRVAVEKMRKGSY